MLVLFPSTKQQTLHSSNHPHPTLPRRGSTATPPLLPPMLDLVGGLGLSDLASSSSFGKSFDFS